MFRPKTLFIAKNRALGDAIMGLSSVQYLRTLYPESTIIYGVPQWTKSLFDNVKTEADLIYPMDTNSFSSILGFWQDLLNFNVDAIYEMHQSGRGEKVFKTYSFLNRVPYFFHNHHLKNGTKIKDQGIIKPLIQRDLDGVYSCLGHLGKYPHYEDFAPSMIANSQKRMPRIIFGVVATRETKMWPLYHFKKLAELILIARPEIKIAIPLSPSAQDMAIKTEIEKLNFPKNCEIVFLKLSDLPKYFKESLMYIGNDTGIKHLACAVDIPSITLFGPEPTLEWHPYNTAKHQFFYRDHLPCRTKIHHYCGLFKCDLADDFHQCLTKILPGTIFETSLQMLKLYS